MRIKEPRDITETRDKLTAIKYAGRISYGATFTNKANYYMEFEKGIHFLTTKGNSLKQVVDQMYSMLLERQIITRKVMLCH